MPPTICFIFIRRPDSRQAMLADSLEFGNPGMWKSGIWTSERTCTLWEWKSFLPKVFLGSWVVGKIPPPVILLYHFWPICLWTKTIQIYRSFVWLSNRVLFTQCWSCLPALCEAYYPAHWQGLDRRGTRPQKKHTSDNSIIFLHNYGYPNSLKLDWNL